ncbi:MAG: sialate O-acetylesterase [Cyanobacteria bacterium J06598_3]
MPQGSIDSSVSVYLMAGQSNLVGEALVENLDLHYRVSFPAAQIWGISPSREGTHGERFVDLAPGFSSYYLHLGPELSFGRQLVVSTRETVYLIKDGLGATTLETDWDPNGINNSYDRFTETVDVALATLTAQGIAYEIKGMVWMQGESDVWVPGFAEQYEENLAVLVSDVRSRYGETLPIAIGLIRGDLPTDDSEPLRQVRAAQRAIATADPYTTLVNTDALGTGAAVLQSDAVHYNAAGQVLLGKAFAAALLGDEPAHSTAN